MTDSATENDFDFYLKFAKPLVLNLSKPDDRVLAAAWIQKLRDESIGDVRLRTDYLKLLLFVLQRKKLIGTFAEHPNEVTKLTEFPETNLLDVAKELLETESECLREQILNGLATGAGDFPPFSTEHSADLLEYSAAQDIPNFGVHAYYAISNEPLPNWERTEKAVFPKGAASATDKGGSSKISTSTSEPGFKPSPSRSGGKSRPRSRSRPSSPRGGPSPSLGSKPKPDEDRSPPTWGSNLIGVSEPPVRDYMAELASDLTEGGDKYGLMDSSYSTRSAAGTPQKNKVNEAAMTPPYSPILPGGEASVFFLESPPSFFGAQSPPQLPCSTRIGDVQKSPSRKPLSPISEYQYSPELPAGDADPFFLESPPSFLKAESPPAIPCSTRISEVQQSPSRKPLSPIAEYQYSPELPPGGVDPFFLESPPSFFGAESPPQLSYSTRTASPRPFTRTGKTNYDEDLDNMEDIEIADEAGASGQVSAHRRTIDDDLDAFDKMIADFERDGTCPIPPCQPQQEPSQQPPSLAKKQRKKIVQKKSTQKKPAVRKQIVVKTESAKSISQQRPSSAATQRRNIKQQAVKTATARVQSRQSTSEIKRPRPGPSAISARQGPQVRPSRSFQPVATSREASKIAESTGRGPQAALSAIPRPGSSRPGGTRLPVAGSRIPAPGSSRIPAPGSSRIPAPGSSRIPAPGSRQIPSQDGSRIPYPGDSRIGESQSRSRIPGLRGEQTRIPKQGTSRIPGPGAAATRNVAPGSPLLPLGDADPFFLETPPSFLDQASLSSVSSAEYPSIFGVTPFPKKSPQRSPLDQTNMTDSFPSPYRGTPPRRSPCGVCTSPSSRLEETVDSLPSAYRGTPPSRRPPISSPEYDVDLLKELGLEPDDLKTDLFDLDDFNLMDISRLTTSSGIQYEEPPDFNIQNESIDEALDAWDRQIAELETEHAEDIALYGSPAEELPRETQRFQEESDLLNAEVVPIIPEESQAAQDIIEEANKQFTRSFQRSTPSPKRQLDKSLDSFEEHERMFSASSPPKRKAPTTRSIPPGSRAQDLIDAAGRARMQYEQLVALSPTSPASSLKSFEELEREVAEDSFLADIPASQPPLRTPPGLSAPQVAEQMAQRQQDQLRRTSLEEEYERYKQLLKRRRPDVPRTPPLFSKFKSMMGDEANRVYQPGEFGETSATEWESGEKFFEGKTSLSPRVGERGSEVKQLYRGSDRRKENELFFEQESMPELDSLENEYENTSIRERSPAAAKTDIKRQLYQVKSELSQRKESTPADGGLPLTTPRRSPSPKRRGRPVTLNIESGDEMMTFEIPPYASPEINLFDESPPTEFDDYENTSIRERSPAATKTDRKRQLYQVKSEFSQRKESTPAEGGVPLTTPRRSPSPKRRPVTLNIDSGDEMMTFEIPPYASPEVNLLEESPPFGLESPRTPHKTPPRSPGSPVESPSSLRTRLLQGEAPPYYRQNEMLVYSGKPKIVKRRSARPALQQIHESPETTPRRRKMPVEPEDTTGFRKDREALEKKFAHLPQVTQIAPDDLFDVEGYMAPSTSPYSVLDSSIPEENLPSPLRLPPQVPGWSTPPHLKIQKITRSRQTTMPELIPELSHHLPVTPRRRDILSQEIPPTELMYSPPMMSPGSAPQLQRRTPSPRSRSARSPVTTPNIFSVMPDDNLGDNLIDEEFPESLYYSPERPQYGSPGGTQTNLPKSARDVRDLFNAPLDSSLLDEALPEDLYYSPGSPVRPQYRLRSPESPISSPESPSSLRLRLWQGDEPPYYSQDVTHVVSGRSKAIKRHSAPPGVHAIRELPDDYSEEQMPFMSQVDAASKKWPKRSRRKIVAAPRVSPIRESPMRVPHVTEVEDTTGFRKTREQLEERYADLPEIPYNAPEDLFGVEGYAAPCPGPYGELDYNIPEGLPSPMRPPTVLPGWSTPPNLKTQHIGRPRWDTVPDLPPEWAGEVKMQPRLRNILSQEMPPTEMMYSPPPLSPRSSPQIRKSPEKQDVSPISARRTQGNFPGHPRDLFNIPLDSSLLDEALPEDLYYSPGSPVRPQKQQDAGRTQGSFPGHPRDLFNTSLDSSLLDEALPEDLYYSPGSPESPVRPQRRLRSPESPISSPESPFSLRLRLWQGDEPPYYSQDVTHVVSGRSKAIKRHSAPPKVHGIRELPDDYSEEHMPFMSQVDAASKKWPKRSRRKIVAAPRVSPIRESPIRVPYVTEVDDPTGFRAQREQLERQFAWLPEIPYAAPDDLFGVEGYTQPCPRPYSELDRNIPEGVPSPLRPPTVLPGWSTPPNLKRQHIERPRLDTAPYLPPEWAHIPEFLSNQENINLKHNVRDVISQEAPPMGIAYSPPPLSPRSSPEFRPKTPDRRPPPRSIYQHSRSPPSPAAPEWFSFAPDVNLLDSLEPEDLYYSPEPASPPFAESPVSSPESPTNLRLRLQQQARPPYYSRDTMHVVVGGKRKAVKRHSAPPRVQNIREVSDIYTDEDEPFLSRIDAAKINWPRRTQRMKIPAPTFSPVRERPMDVPNITETDDPTGFRRVREQLERKYADLPELPQNLPDDLMGAEGQVEWNQFMSELDRTPPRHIRSPIKPPAVVPGWTTPPHLRRPVQEPEPYQIKLIPGLRDILFQEGPPPGMEYSPPPLKSPCGVCEQTPPGQRYPTLSTRTAGNIFTDASPYIDRESFPEGFSSPGDQQESPALHAPLLGRPGDVFKQSPEFLELEMPPEEFMPADGTPPTPSHWDRLATRGSPWSPDTTVDSFEEHEKQLLGPDASIAPPRRKSPSPKQLEAARLASMRAMDQLKLLDEKSPISADTTDSFEKHEKEFIESPCVCPAPRRPEIDRRELPSVEQLQAARLATRNAMEQLKQLDGKKSSPDRKQAVSERSLLDRVEDIVADIPEPQMPRRKPETPPQYEIASPEWSPQLPNLPQFADQIENEFLPQDLWSSPKTPASSPIRSPMTPAQASDSSKQSDYSPTRPSGSPAPNIFDVEPADADFLDQILPPEFLVRSPTSPLSPPTPPRIADYYQVHTPPSPGSPTELAESLQAHQFTEQYFDRGRKLMSDRIRVKNKVVPVIRSKRPNISPIREDSPRSAPLVRQEQFVQLPPRVVKTETTVTKETSFHSPDKPGRQVDFGFDFKSPPKQAKIQIPPKYVYGPNIEQIDSNLLERYKLRRRDLFKDQSPQAGIFETSPPGDYSFSSPQRFTPPTGSPSGRYVLSRQSPDQFLGQPQRISVGQRQYPQQPSSRVCYSPNYELPMANYYGSPGRMYVRTPGRRVEKTVTVFEEEPYPDFVVSDRIPFAETEYPEIYDTSLIAEDLDASFMEEGMAGFQWMG